MGVTSSPIPAQTLLKDGLGWVEVAWGSSVILGTAAIVINGNGSPWSRAGNVRTRNCQGWERKILGASLSGHERRQALAGW